MGKAEFTKCLKILTMAYSKDIDLDLITLWYSYLKNYSYETLFKAVNEIIRTKKFMPTIAEVIEYCNKYVDENKFKILKVMQNAGYFKDIKEYEKATHFLETNIIPRWFLEDMKKFGYIDANNILNNSEFKLIGGTHYDDN